MRVGHNQFGGIETMAGANFSSLCRQAQAGRRRLWAAQQTGQQDEPDEDATDGKTEVPDEDRDFSRRR